jgi:hypothetical protein
MLSSAGIISIPSNVVGSNRSNRGQGVGTNGMAAVKRGKEVPTATCYIVKT